MYIPRKLLRLTLKQFVANLKSPRTRDKHKVKDFRREKSYLVCTFETVPCNWVEKSQDQGKGERSYPLE